MVSAGKALAAPDTRRFVKILTAPAATRAGRRASLSAAIACQGNTQQTLKALQRLAEQAKDNAASRDDRQHRNRAMQAQPL